MALKTGLFIPNTMGSQTGLNLTRSDYPTAAGATLLHTIDWTPATYAGLDPNNTAAYHWDMQDASGSLTESIVGGGTHDLAPSGGSTGNYYQQTAVGICNGTNLTSRYAVESKEGAADADKFISGSATTLDPSAGSIGFRILFRVFKVPGGSRRLCGKIGTSKGWYIIFDSNGYIYGRVNDGTGEVSVQLAQNHCDGAWHMAELIVDWTTGFIKFRSDLGTGTSGSISGLTQANCDGGSFTVMGIDTGNPLRRCQVADMYGWTGSAAEALSSDAIADIWNHGADPNAGTIFEDDTISYTGVAWAPVGEQLFAAYSGDAGQFPIGYSDRFSDLPEPPPNNFGVFTQGNTFGVENIITESERLEDAYWTPSGSMSIGSTAAAMVDNVAGFRQCRTITDSGSGGEYLSGTTIAGGTAVTCTHIFVKSNGGTVSGKLQLWDEVAASAAWEESFTVSSTTQFSVVGHYGNNTTNNKHLRIQIDTAGGSIAVCGVYATSANTVASTGPSLGWYVPTFGASVTADNTTGKCSFGAGNELDIRDAMYVRGYFLTCHDLGRTYSVSWARMVFFDSSDGGLSLLTYTQDQWEIVPEAGESSGRVSHGLGNNGYDGLYYQTTQKIGGGLFGGEDTRSILYDPNGSSTIDYTPAAWTGAVLTSYHRSGGSFDMSLSGYLEVYSGAKRDL